MAVGIHDPRVSTLLLQRNDAVQNVLDRYDVHRAMNNRPTGPRCGRLEPARLNQHADDAAFLVHTQSLAKLMEAEVMSNSVVLVTNEA